MYRSGFENLLLCKNQRLWKGMLISIFNKIFLISLFTIAVSSCGGGFEPSNRGEITLPSNGDRKIWNFDIPSEYGFNSDFLEIDNGVVKLKTINYVTNDLSSFNNGSYAGTEFVASSPLGYLQLDVDGLGTPTNNLNALTTPQFTELVGYWSFEGGFSDSSLEGNNGAALGDSALDSIIYKAGSQSVVFDKAGDAVTIADDDSLDVDLSSGLTLSAWVRFDDIAGLQRVLSKACFNGTSWENASFALSKIATDQVTFTYSTDGTSFTPIVTTNQLLREGEWFHLMATYDGATSKVFINGQLDSSQASTGVIFNGTEPIYLGARADGVGCSALTSEMGGNLDDVAIWKVALSEAEVSDIYHLQKQSYSGVYTSSVFDAGASIVWPSLAWITSLPFMKELSSDIDNNGLADSESTGDSLNPIYPKLVGNSGVLSGNNLLSNLILYFKFNGSGDYTGVASEVIDHSGGGAVGAPPSPNHGTAVGGTISSEPGVHYEARRFAGTGARIEVNTFAASPTFVGNKTISLWVKLDKDQLVTTGTTNTIILDGDGISLSTTIGVHNQTALVADAGKIFVTQSDGVNTPTVTSTQPLNDGEFHHILFRQDNLGNLELYVDGVSNDTAINTAAGTYAASYRLRVNDVASNSFSGAIDELAVWRKSLHPTQILQLYKRAANRVKIQVKTCADIGCQCHTLAGVDPNDCDNDTIANNIDFSDANKAVWLGPTGSGVTSFSELVNNDTISASAQGVGLVQRESPSLDFTDFSVSGLSLISNQYFQFRVLMESSDKNLSCAGQTCVPELHSLQVGSGNLYAGTAEIENTLAFSYDGPIGIINFDEVGSAPNCEYNYRLSNDDGVTWYYYNGGWVVATQDPPGPPAPHYNSASVVQANIGTFFPTWGGGTGEFRFKAFIRSNDAITSCDLNQVDITLQDELL